MSPMLIAALVIGGLVILVSIGFISQAMERARLDRARALAELRARLTQCTAINDSLPGQFMSPELKTTLLRVEADLLSRLIKLDANNTKLTEQLAAVQQQLAKSDPPIKNQPVTFTNEAAAQSAQLQLNDLQRILHLAQHDGLLDKATVKRWHQEFDQHLYQTTLTMYQTVANEAMQAGKPRVAKLQYERAISYISNRPHTESAGQLAVFRQLLENAEHAALRMEQSSSNGPSELVAGVQELEEEDKAWKKKSVYDD